MDKLKVFTGEQDKEIADKLASEIMPLIKGKTVQQATMALSQCLELLKISMTLD